MTEKRPLKLEDLLTQDTVRTKQTASDWRDVARIAGNVLVQAGTIESRYIDASIRVLEELGPYAVIAPGIVLLHARPEDGVLETTLGLITLAEPVCFGSPENDPVDLAFILGALDKEQHVQALQRLAGLLSSKEFLDNLRSAETTKDILAAFSSDTGR